MSEVAQDVIVVGAGISGLAAARTLAESGKRVLVIEARNRVGGRILTDFDDNGALELGAEFVHGKPPELWQLIDEAGLETYELDGKQFCWENQTLSECSRGLDDDFQWMEALKEWKEPDCSFREYLDRAHVPQQNWDRLIGYVEGFNAADHRVIGVASLAKQQSAEDEIEGDRLFRIRGGYAQVPEFLAAKLHQAGGSIVFDAVATAVRWQQGRVDIECVKAGESRTYTAASAVITLPLGVLQGGAVRFSPEPAEIFSAASRMRMGHAFRAVLAFREPLWSNHPDRDALRELSFLFSFQQTPPVWWTQHPEDSRTLTAWAAGPRADAIATADQKVVVTHLCEFLAEAFRSDPRCLRDLLLKSAFHDWQSDPFSAGAYSYVSAGALDASELLSRPVQRTLYFAGEHTDTSGHWGTVHGALRSGLRAARQILIQN